MIESDFRVLMKRCFVCGRSAFLHWRSYSSRTSDSEESQLAIDAFAQYANELMWPFKLNSPLGLHFLLFHCFLRNIVFLGDRCCGVSLGVVIRCEWGRCRLYVCWVIFESKRLVMGGHKYNVRWGAMKLVRDQATSAAGRQVGRQAGRQVGRQSTRSIQQIPLPMIA